MHAASPSPRRDTPWHPLIRWIAGAFFLLLMIFTLAPGGAHAAPPPAGATISNQASATYSDGSGVSRTVSSNQVITAVTQVFSLTLSAPGSQSATPGSVVYYPHTLTNTGNGSDTFNLSAAHTSGTFTMVPGSIEIYADNGSGQPIGPAITSSGVVNAGASFKFIVRATVPNTALATNTNKLTVTATSVGDNTKTATNADDTLVTGNAVVTLTKAVSVSSGPATATGIEYTLTYTNTGNSTASAVKITDQLPVGMEMFPLTSGRWSVTGATPLSTTGGSVGTLPNRLTSSYTTLSRTFEATIDEVAPGQSGQVRFTVRLTGTPPPGVLNNFATVGYNTGGTPATANATSNTVAFTVTQTASVTFAGSAFGPSPAPAGSTVSASNLLTNTGNGTDTFNVTLGSTADFPSGTTFQLFKSDGSTPLVDTNGDSIVDTGPLAAGASYNVVLKATLPPNATNATAPFTVTKIARSVVDNTRTATATDTLAAISAAAVDLTNNSPAGASVPGNGVFPTGEALPQVTKAINPGTSTVFVLYANNTSSSPDSYNFAAGSSTALAALPSGWTVEFRTATGGAGDVCGSMGTTVTNTGTINAGAAAAYCAVVSVPAGYLAGNQALYFRLLSPSSAAVDMLHDRVTVNAVRAISLAPNGAGQTYPGGSYVYAHALTNNGNVNEGGTLSTLTPDVPVSGGWSSTLYVDSNGNGALDAGDAVVTGAFPGALASGASITVFHRVIAPSGAVPGSVYAATITVTTANLGGGHTITAPAPAVATDSTTVIAGNLTLTKVQALDAACDGTADGAYGPGNLNARPGQCVLYKVTVSNVGTASATNVIVSDATPTHTRIAPAALAAPKVSTGGGLTPGQLVAPPAAGAAGTIKAHIGADATAGAGGTLPAGQSAEITFGVKIDE